MRTRTGALIVAALTLASCGGAPAPAGGRDSSQAPTPLAVRHDENVAAGGTSAPGAVMQNPYAGQAKSATEGEKLFASMNCDGCHGGGATGWVGPSLSDGRWRYGGSDGAVFESIYYGRPQGMPAFGGLLSPEITWKLVTYLRSLPQPKTVPTQSW